MRENSGHGAGSVILSFLLGGAVGAGLALLFAPQSGYVTRQKIKEFTDEMKDTIDTTAEKGKDFFEGKKSVIASAFEAGKKAYDKEKEKFSKS
jgi:gas vesicle protein